jgi:hypothetical protein
MVLTGFTIENGYALLVAVGAGFYTAVGAGILVQAGVTFYQVHILSIYVCQYRLYMCVILILLLLLD